MPSCPVALLQGDLASIKQLCGYRIQVGQIFRVGNDKLLFSNITDVTITCYDANATFVTTARPTGRQFVVQFQLAVMFLQESFKYL